MFEAGFGWPGVYSFLLENSSCPPFPVRSSTERCTQNAPPVQRSFHFVNQVQRRTCSVGRVLGHLHRATLFCPPRPFGVKRTKETAQRATVRTHLIRFVSGPTHFERKLA